MPLSSKLLCLPSFQGTERNRNIMPYTAFIFDLDGTLLNTLSDIACACNTMLQRHGFPVHVENAYRQFVGNGFATLTKRILPKNVLKKLDDEELNNFILEGKALYHTSLHVRTKPYIGMPEALAELKKRNVSLAVLSNKPDPETKELVNHFFPGIFPVVHGGRDGIPLKPDPTAVYETIADLGVAKEQCAYVGDSNVDMMTAANAGLFSIGVTWGFRGEAELAESKASALVSRAEELLQYA